MGLLNQITFTFSHLFMLEILKLQFGRSCIVDNFDVVISRHTRTDSNSVNGTVKINQGIGIRIAVHSSQFLRTYTCSLVLSWFDCKCLGASRVSSNKNLTSSLSRLSYILLYWNIGTPSSILKHRSTLRYQYGSPPGPVLVHSRDSLVAPKLA